MSEIEAMGAGPEQQTDTQAESVSDAGQIAAETAPNTPEGDAAQVAPAYEPNFKFSVMDKEHEIPEAFRGIIKDADSEKLAREVFEKAYGLDYVKPKYESTKSQLDQIQREYEPIKKDLAVLSQLLENQDLGAFFQAFGLTDEAIIKHSMERLEYHQMPPEKRQMMDAQRAQSLDYYKTQQELSELKAQRAQNELQSTYSELKSHVSAPHIQSISESFNARAGQQDAFEKAVIAHAQNHFALNKQDLTVPQAIESFIRTFGLAASPQASSGAAQAGAQAFDRKPTLPKTGSGSVAPVKAKVKSIADIRKAQEQFFEN